MSLAGARGIARIASNLGCERQAAMVAERCKETELYRRMTGREYPREYGERVSARRRGHKFEANLYQNDAALLKKAVGPRYGHKPVEMWVRNMLEELPGSKEEHLALRASRMGQVLRDLSKGNLVPDLVIQPALVLPIGPNRFDDRLISPDFLVLDRISRMYVPGELKSFIVRDVGPDPEDLAPTRLQAAAQILALRAAVSRYDMDSLVSDRAVFVFATPYGLMPTDGIEEWLRAEVAQVQQAIAILAQTKLRLTALRRVDGTRFPNLFHELRPNYRESCLSRCALADVCREHHVGHPAELGDAAVDQFGPALDLDRLTELATGAVPCTPEEAQIAAALRDAATALGIDDVGDIRRLA